MGKNQSLRSSFSSFPFPFKRPLQKVACNLWSNKKLRHCTTLLISVTKKRKKTFS